jgi:hypothetical protein
LENPLALTSDMTFVISIFSRVDLLA